MLCGTSSQCIVWCGSQIANEWLLKQCVGLHVEVDLLVATLTFSAGSLIGPFVVLQIGPCSGQFCVPKLCVLGRVVFHITTSPLFIYLFLLMWPVE